MAAVPGAPDTARVSATSAPTGGGPALALRDPVHGPLPGLLLALMVVAGAVDTVSVLKLGRVFVANMTGNIVFAGFAAVGTPGFPLLASALAVAGFLAGAWAGSRVGRRRAVDRARLLAEGASIECALFVAAAAFTLAVPDPSRGPAQYALSLTLAFALGSQNAMARRLGVPDLTATVLTSTLTGLAADLRPGRWRSPTQVRRAAAIVAMLLGAAGAAALVLHGPVAAGLGLVAGVTALVALGAWATTRHDAPWRTAA